MYITSPRAPAQRPCYKLSRFLPQTVRTSTFVPLLRRHILTGLVPGFQRRQIADSPSLPTGGLVQTRSLYRLQVGRQPAMPSFRPHHRRTYSWPPSWHHISPAQDKGTEAESPTTELDEDPFSHFISPVMDEDDPFDNLAYSAGIVVNESDTASKTSKFCAGIARKWAQYVEINHEALHELYHIQPDDIDSDFDEHDADVWDDKDLPGGVAIPVIHEPAHSRREQILAVVESRGKRRRPGRTLSGHRHSWQEPSLNLFTVLEENDDGPAGTEPLVDVEPDNKTEDGASRRSVEPRMNERAKL